MVRPFQELIPSQLAENGFLLLSTDLKHLNKVIELPLIHRDPFDRLIIAQACVENMVIITADLAFQSYEIDILW